MRSPTGSSSSWNADSSRAHVLTMHGQHRRSPSSSRSAWRARVSRDFTVPTGNSSENAISSYSKTFHLPQHQRRSLFERQMLERRFQPRAELLPRELPIGRRCIGAQHHLAVIADVLVERNLIRPRPAPPPALPVSHLVDDDAEDPGAQRGLRAEAVQGAEDPEEHFLGHVERFFAVAQEMGGEPEDQPVVLEHERGVGAFRRRQGSAR